MKSLKVLRLFEWKLSPGSNSGFIWGVSEDKCMNIHMKQVQIQIIDTDYYGDDPDIKNPLLVHFMI